MCSLLLNILGVCNLKYLTLIYLQFYCYSLYCNYISVFCFHTVKGYKVKCGEGCYLIHRWVTVKKVNVKKSHLIFLKNVGKSNSIRGPLAYSLSRMWNHRRLSKQNFSVKRLYGCFVTQHQLPFDIISVCYIEKLKDEMRMLICMLEVKF